MFLTMRSQLMTNLQTELLSGLLATALTEFKKDQPAMNLQNDYYEDVIKCLEYALTGQ